MTDEAVLSEQLEAEKEGEADYSPDFERLGQLIPEPGMLIGADGKRYPVFFDFYALREMERLLDQTIFEFELVESEIKSDLFLQMLKLGIQGGVRRQWRHHVQGDKQPEYTVDDIDDLFVQVFVDDLVEFIGNSITAVAMIWVAIKLAWSTSLKPPTRPVPGIAEVTEGNPTQGA